MTPQAFVAKWSQFTGGEMTGYTAHFNDLCRVLGHPEPAEADPSQTWFCFQRSLQQEKGTAGFADVFYAGKFGWEYKGNNSDLDAAYRQLLQYRTNLNNPPLLVVSDFQRFRIHTAFNNSITRTFKFTLQDLLKHDRIDGTPFSAIELLRVAFSTPDVLNPNLTPEELTEDVAAKFAGIADDLRGILDAQTRQRRYGDEQISRFLTRIVFCMFASDVGLLPPGILTRLIDNHISNATHLKDRMQEMFRIMQTGGDFGENRILHFNGGLFAEGEALLLTGQQARMIREADQVNWADLEPSIFGTLFERVLDPDRRKQIGAHYTSRSDIELIVKPVLMDPLQREWDELRPKVELISQDLVHTTSQRQEWIAKMRGPMQDFIDRLETVRVLDPACGSGNFLYVSLALLKGLEQEVISYAASKAVTNLVPKVHPRQLHGIEVDSYAHELASMVVWIGYLQWKHKNGIPFETETPILEPLTNVQHMDAIIDRSDSDAPHEPEWPAADVIVGNPPFLGTKKLRANLGDDYVRDLFKLYGERIPGFADLCCYWFEKAREQVASGYTKRAGLLATQAIRNKRARVVLQRIKDSGDIFFAESDRRWVLEGAAVNVSMIGFDNGSEPTKILDGRVVAVINSDLSSDIDLTAAVSLIENLGIAFIADVKGGPFDINEDEALAMIRRPNPDGRLNAEVIKPWVNGLDITRRRRNKWIIDFGSSMTTEEAALYEAPFEYALQVVKPARGDSRTTQRDWWIHERPGPSMRRALQGLSRFAATPILTKYRLFIWLEPPTLADHQLVVFARDDDYFLGVLQARPHLAWALKKGTKQETRPRYTPTTSFETFPLPWSPGKEPTNDGRIQSIASAARDLDQLRNGWLNPLPGTLEDLDLAKRTLTNLYNESPTWLRNAHRNLDEAVLDAYGWPHDITDDELLAKLLELNLARAST